MKVNIFFRYMMHTFAAFLLLSPVQIDAAAAKFRPQAAAAQVITQKIPANVQEFAPVKQSFEAAIAQAVNQIQNFNPMQGNPIQIRSSLNQAKSSLDLARGYLSNLLAGYTKIKNLSQPKATLNAQGINDAFFKTNNDLIRDLDRQFSEKEAQLAQRARAAEADAKKQTDIAAREKQRANVQETDIDQFAQALDRAQAEATDWRLKFEATQKQLEQLQEEQKKFTSVIPMLQQKALVADKSKAEIDQLNAKHQAELQRLQQAHAAQAADRDAALQRALQEASQLRQEGATIAQLQMQLQQLTGHNEQLQAQVGNVAQIEAVNDRLQADLAAAHAENEKNKSLDGEVKRLQSQLTELSDLREQNHALSAKAADAARLHEEQKKAAADLQTAHDQAEALKIENQKLAADLASSRRDDTQRLAQNKQTIAELDAQTEKVRKLTEQNTQLNDRVAAAEEERRSLGEAQARIRELEPSVQKLAALQHEMDDLRQQAALAQKVPGLEAQVEQLPVLQEKAAQADRANAENLKLAADNARLQAQEKAHEEHAQSTANRIAQLTAANEKLEKQVVADASLQKELERIRKELAFAHGQNEKLDTEKRDQFLELEAANRKLGLKLLAAEKELDALRSQNNASNSSHANQVATLTAQLAAAAQQSEQQTAAQARAISELQRQLTDAQSKNDEMQAQLDSALAQAKAAQATSASAEEELKKLRNDHNEQSVANAAMSKALNEQAAKLSDLQTQNAQLKAILERLSAFNAATAQLKALTDQLKRK